jgi:oligoendopeptidase F
MNSPKIPEVVRSFLPQEFSFSEIDDITHYLERLLNENIDSEQSLKDWLKNRDEVYSFLSEYEAWLYINYTRYTDNEEYSAKFNAYNQEVKPHLSEWGNKLTKKLLNSKAIDSFSSDTAYKMLIRSEQEADKIFRLENIPLQKQIDSLTQEYASISGAMTIEYKGEELTFYQANTFLQSEDRMVRKEVYELIQERRLKDADRLNSLFDELYNLRTEIAKNSGFSNFRDYKFTQLQRFDYTQKDVDNFASSIEEFIVPINKKFNLKFKEKLGLDTLKPYDSMAVVPGEKPLKVPDKQQDLLKKSYEMFAKVHPYVSEAIAIMEKIDRLDLESRKGKAPGGYNYPLEETGIPFIFMNSTGKLRDLVTLVHEAGHAVHSFTCIDLPLASFRSTPSEVAELASMSMELLTMEYWDVYFTNRKDYLRAQIEHLEDALGTLSWIATIDTFQNKVYIQSNPSIENRITLWNETFNRFNSGVTDFSGYEKFLDVQWHKQLHIFEVPFYYIEYGIAQIGALQVWRNYKEDKKSAVEKYLSALKLGYQRSIPEIYETAGIKFDFSENTINNLAAFVLDEIEKLETELNSLS